MIEMIEAGFNRVRSYSMPFGGPGPAGKVEFIYEGVPGRRIFVQPLSGPGVIRICTSLFSKAPNCTHPSPANRA